MTGVSEEVQDNAEMGKVPYRPAILSIFISYHSSLTLIAPISTKVACFSRLLKYLRSLYGKQGGPRSDCSYRSSLFWVQAV